MPSLDRFLARRPNPARAPLSPDARKRQWDELLKLFDETRR